MWLLHQSVPWFSLGDSFRRHFQVFSVHASVWLCDQFYCFTFHCCLSLLAEGQKWAGKEKGMAQKTPQSPSPFKWDCLWICTPQPFPARKIERCWTVFLFLFLKLHCDLILRGWIPSLTCSQISHLQVFLFWFCLCSGLHIPLHIEISLNPFLLFLYTLKIHLQHCTFVFFVFGLNRTKFLFFVNLIWFSALSLQTALKIMPK